MEHCKLQVYDPPMCCSSGVCGPNVDPALARFSGDLDWLRNQGGEVQRFNLSSHPGAFAQQECVREALTKEGNNCLPLVLVDGSIISRGIYPSRSKLMKAMGMNDQPKNQSQQNVKDEPAACGPGCDCNTAPRGRGLKIAITLLVLFSVAGAVAYRATTAVPDASSTAKSSGFAVAQTATEVTPEDARQSSSIPGKIGQSLQSINDLNTVAQSQAAVFIFIPGKENEAVSDKTSAAVLGAQKTLGKSNISLGLFTLPTSSPDYAGIAKQIQTPAVIVASKGRGSAAVTGDITETRLLQAFVATMNASCGPSGCGPAGCN